MRCKYLEDSQCKSKATHLYGEKIGVCEHHKAMLEKLIESKGGLVGDEFVEIKKNNWKILARHKWVAGAVITESCNEKGYRRFTATIRGWRNWKIWQGETAGKDMKERTDEVIRRVVEIREKIDNGDKTVFNQKGAW